MRWIQRVALFGSGAIISAVLIVGLAFYLRLGNRVASGVSAGAIRTVRPGMTLAELGAHLGSPIQIRAKSPTDASTFYFDYTESGWLNEGYAITVAATSSQVVSVLVEYADMVIYQCDAEKCPAFVRGLTSWMRWAATDCDRSIATGVKHCLPVSSTAGLAALPMAEDEDGDGVSQHGRPQP